MLGSAFHCITKIGALMLATAMLTACGGGGAGSEAPAAVIGQTSRSVETSSTPATPLSIERSSATNINLTLSSSSVGKLTDSPTIASSSASVISTSSKTNGKSSSLNAVAVNSTAAVTISSANVSSGSIAAKSTSSAASSNKNTSSAASRSSNNAISSSSNKASSSKASSISSKASSASSKASSSSKTSSSAATKLGATITWSHPTAREDGSYLTLDEIGGYKIRFKAISASADTFIYVSLPGTNVTSYKFPSSALGLEFEIAVYDSHGLYSEYVHIYSN